jgi:hypothetical protein
MKITIINGENKSSTGSFTRYMAEVTAHLQKVNSVDLFSLAEMHIKYCRGCWTCWWKTPGICAIKDDAPEIFKSAINSDLLVFSSPVTAGFTSSVLKKITDRLIVLLHPYIMIREKECHHRKRYDRYPDIGLIVEKDNITDEEDIRIIADIYDRIAVNFHSKMRFLMIKDEDSIEKIVRTIQNTQDNEISDHKRFTTQI